MSTIIGEIECQNGQLNKIRLGDNTWQSINTMLYLPTNYDPANKYPCIIFGHGNGEAGTDLDTLLQQGLPYVLNEHINSGDIATTDLDKFIIFCLQSSWVGGPVIGDQIGALQYLQTKLSIDPNRIYFTGLSVGGGSAAYAIPAYPSIFAAVVPMSTTNTNSDDASKFSNGYAWFMHSVNDTICQFAYSLDFAQRINSAFPGHAVLTSFEDGHGGWIPHYEPSWKWMSAGIGGQDIGEPNGLNIYQWMLQYSLNNTVVSPVIVPPVIPPIPIVPPATITKVTIDYSDGTSKIIQ